jgi:hypothetical protein
MSTKNFICVSMCLGAFTLSMMGCSNDLVAPTVANEENNTSVAKVGTNGALDVGCGGGRANRVWAISKDFASSYGNGIYWWNGVAWTQTSGAGIKIDCDNIGNAWVVNSNNQLFKYSSNTWTEQTKKAIDVGCGGGKVWLISTEPSDGGFMIYRLDGTSWVPAWGAGVSIDCDYSGNAWVINSYGQLFKYTSVGTWVAQSKKARDVGCGEDGSVWIVSTESAPSGGYLLYKLSGTSWVLQSGAGVSISVDGRGKPWVVNSLGEIYELVNVTWTKR